MYKRQVLLRPLFFMQYILFRRQLFFNRENIAMSESHTKLEELPFSFQGVEEKYGSLIDAEELCPGVYLSLIYI